MRRTVLLPALPMLLACEVPPTSVPEAKTGPTLPAGLEWTKDTVPLHSYPAGADFEPDTIFPFHIYWYDAGHGGVPERVRVAVRRAAAQWASIISPTEVLPYVFEEDVLCRSYDFQLEYAEGDTLAGGFHVYVTADRRWDRPGTAGSTVGPCIPTDHDYVNWVFNWSYHPVTNAPPNGTVFISPSYAERASDSHLEGVALHEIGHNLGVGIGKRWRTAMVKDSVLVGGEYKQYWVQADTIAVQRYVAMAERSPHSDPVYPLQKIPTHYFGHWHFCTLRTEHDGMDVMVPFIQAKPRITEVSAAMLQGFKVNWDVFGDPENGNYWTPEPSWFRYCPEAAAGVASDEDEGAVPDFPVLDNDVRLWDYIGLGR